ncbi:MAG: uncharacterized protein KVP18_001660 [Porospora cf. gigantea A]|uniref:uncharacterized protein n=1 Tax=Porospora cf. gigantea A TaxID=2853593 RepID=UPI003559D45E|nr:MAG: hypothetical protein KVP18_001660 [Porospora cf. gigantea A]
MSGINTEPLLGPEAVASRLPATTITAPRKGLYGLATVGSIVAVCALAYYAIGSHPATPVAALNRNLVCSSPTCDIIRERIDTTMNLSSDPCTRPYEYFCGTWHGHYDLPATEALYTLGFSTGWEDTFKRDFEVLNKFTCEEAKKTGDSWDAYLACYYASCLADGEGSVEALMKALPFLHPDAEFSLGETVGAMAVHGFRVFYDTEASPDPLNFAEHDANTAKQRFILNSAKLTLPYPMYDNQSQLTSLENHFQSLLTQFLKALQLPTTGVRDRAVAAVALEKMLRDSGNSPDADHGPSTSNFHVKWAALKQQLPLFGTVRDVVRREVGDVLQWTDDTNLVVGSTTYWAKLRDVLANTPDQTLKDFALIKVLNEVAFTLTDDFRRTAEAWKSRATGASPLSRELKCRLQAEKHLPWILSRGFIKTSDFATAKRAGQEVAVIMRSTFTNLLKSAWWMDEQTKKFAVDKISSMTMNIGYPEWLLNEEQCDAKFSELYGIGRIDAQDSFAHDVLDANVAFVQKFLDSLQGAARYAFGREGLPRDLSNWDFPPCTVNGMYQPSENTFTLPAGVTVQPFFFSWDENTPRIEKLVRLALSLGGMGQTIGHEMMHGFDDQGRLYSKAGKLVDWWSPEAEKNFSSVEHCVDAQYSQYGLHIRDPEGRATDQYLNGFLSLSENLADNAGSQTAFRALLDQMSEEEKKVKPFPGLDLTIPELFFHALSYEWCEVGTDAFNYHHLLSDPHASGSMRIKGMVQNFPQWFEIHQCQSRVRGVAPTREKLRNIELLGRFQSRPVCNVW